MLKLILLFTMVPAIELYFLLEAGDAIGGFNTIMIVVLTGIIGARLARVQGAQVIAKMQSTVGQGQMPADALLEGFLVFGGGLLLLTPGFFTDFIGLSLIFPLTRLLYIRNFKTALEKKMKDGSFKVYQYGAGSAGGGFRYSNNQQSSNEKPRVYEQGGHEVIDVSAERKD
ncbi:MAG: FxsA family protein [Bdellovibrionales bacterium]